MRVYVAAARARRDEMRTVHDTLRANGHNVTSRWVDEDGDGMSARDQAERDVHDVMQANTLMLFTDPRDEPQVGGGRYFEAGLAYGKLKMVILVGSRSSVFCHLPSIFMCDTLRDALTTMKYLT